jgi:hypothetical protein
MINIYQKINLYQKLKTLSYTEIICLIWLAGLIFGLLEIGAI